MMPTLRKLSVAQWRTNRPRRPDPERPALIQSRRVIVTGLQGVPPIEEAQILCDDNTVRTFVSGPEGRWQRKR